MKLNFCRVATYGLFISAVWPATGGPLRRADLPAEPAWLAHVDCDGLRATTVGQYIQDELAKPEAVAKLAAFQSLFNFDLRTQLHGLTLYGTGPAAEGGVLLVYATFDTDRLVTLAKGANDSQSTPYKHHVIYSWLDEKRKPRHGAKGRTYAAIQGDRVVFGQRQEAVEGALDVLDGAVASLGSSRAFPQVGTPGDTSCLEAAARKMEVPANEPRAALLRLAQSGRVQVGESQGQVVAKLTLQANDGEVAGTMTSIAQGLLALMKLQKEKPESARLADGISIKQEGSHLVVMLELPAAEVVDILKTDAARKAQKKADASTEK